MRVDATAPKLSICIVPILLAMILGMGWAEPAVAQEKRLGFGADVGLWAGTSDDTVFALAFNLDYYLDPAFSVGPMVLFSPSTDLTQVAFAPVARFHILLDAVSIVPFAGVGFVHADVERTVGPVPVDLDDISYYIPLGVALEVPISRKLSVSTTFMFNLHGLEFGPPAGDDDASVALLFGMRFGP